MILIVVDKALEHLPCIQDMCVAAVEGSDLDREIRTYNVVTAEGSTTRVKISSKSNVSGKTPSFHGVEWGGVNSSLPIRSE